MGTCGRVEYVVRGWNGYVCGGRRVGEGWLVCACASGFGQDISDVYSVQSGSSLQLDMS